MWWKSLLCAFLPLSIIRRRTAADEVQVDRTRLVRSAIAITIGKLQLGINLGVRVAPIERS